MMYARKTRRQQRRNEDTAFINDALRARERAAKERSTAIRERERVARERAKQSLKEFYDAAGMPESSN